MVQQKEEAVLPLKAEKDTANNIVFKGYRSGLILVIPDEGAIQPYLKELEDHLDKAKSFFKGAKVSVQTGARSLSESEQTVLTRLLLKNGLVLQQFLGIADREPVAVPFSHKEKEVEPEEFISTITVKKTVRSGQRVQFEGNLLIIGDVNPGAEVIASGDIVVLGKLRGIAHAGANGDENAQIIALQLHPVQIRIAGIISRDSEKGPKNKNNGPEVARLKERLIVVERYPI